MRRNSKCEARILTRTLMLQACRARHLHTSSREITCLSSTSTAECFAGARGITCTGRAPPLADWGMMTKTAGQVTGEQVFHSVTPK